MIRLKGIFLDFLLLSANCLTPLIIFLRRKNLKRRSLHFSEFFLLIVFAMMNHGRDRSWIEGRKLLLGFFHVFYFDIDFYENIFFSSEPD